jgi:hypothetical protein|tara:strand:- start:963 stop:1298 length:336 start_codon:yes stop_codon:yes gene_type:complete
MIKPCLAIVGGIIGIYISVKLLLSFDKPVQPTCDKNEEDDTESSSSEENIIIKRTLTSRMGAFEKKELVKRVKPFSHMKKEELVEACKDRNIDSDGTVRILKTRLKNYETK